MHKIHTTQEFQRRRIQSIVDAAPMCVTCYDTTFTMFECNEAAVSMFDFGSKNDFVMAFRERFFEMFPEIQPGGESTREVVRRAFESTAETGRFSMEFDHFTAHGEDLPTYVHLVRVDYDDTFMIVCYVRDLREERKVESERRRRQVAEETGEAKSRFLARMSHELRTPITAVLGIAEIELQKPGLSPQCEESFAKIHSSANMLLHIVNDVLDLSKIESDKMELVEKEYETAEMISDVTQLHSVFLSNKDIVFSLRVDENMPTRLFGDSLRIKQIMSNLLSNAFKYTEKGSVELDWRADSMVLAITLRDTGLGMTKEQVRLLSGDYLRFHEYENREIGGTGLGVSIVYSLIRMMGGEILIESEPGIGTNVHLRIPQKYAKSSVIGKELAKKLEHFEINTPGKRLSFVPEPMPYGNVLVVDDVSENIYVIKGLLSFYDLRIEVCTSGIEAIEKVKSGKTYDIIFMDHMMPVMNGMVAMQNLREMGYSKPIVAITANAIVGVSEEFKRHGFDGFISKPIQAKHLDEVLHQFVRDKQSLEVIEAARKVHNEVKSNIYEFRHDAGLIEKLKRLFVQRHKNTFAEISAAVKTGDTAHARLLAHTLKSVAGLIHESALANAAQHIEHTLVAGEMPSAENMYTLEAEILRVLAGITTESALPNPDELLVILNRLEPFLEANNAACLDFLDELGAIPEAYIICRQIEDFNYADALKNLNILRRDLF
ncbi:MAG: ATP-binding protein [Defluviitaleaceae bacterium]|nr:ATP-binding protein [Defluviitaleaceae bacterium]